ncbi:hypothetical protein BJV74DRAFT_135142 [Russula compacta]|nr:hypothetical protein BJV74DRAFT_135142 [Russula compacta]
MQWPNLLSKLSPECVYPILRDGQCKPVSDYSNTPNMSSDHHDHPPERSATDDRDESSSIGDSSLLAPPTSHRRTHDFSGLQPDPHEPQSFLDTLAAAHDLSTELATTLSIRSAAASSGPMHANIHSDHSDHFTLPNPHSISPHPFQSHGRASPPNDQLLQQSLVSGDYYAPVESLPPQNYIPPPRTESSSAPFFPPGTGGTSLFSHARGATLPALSIPNPIAFVPPNSELARPPRFTFAPPGTEVPADPVASTSTTPASPSSARSWRDKAKGKRDKTSQQPTQEGSGRRARSNSWTVVSAVFRRRSGVCIARFSEHVVCADGGL